MVGQQEGCIIVCLLFSEKKNKNKIYLSKTFKQDKSFENVFLNVKRPPHTILSVRLSELASFQKAEETQEYQATIFEHAL